MSYLVTALAPFTRSLHSILVVDDNPGAKYAVARTLRACGYRTVEASAGAEALELSEYVSALVLDVHLPDLDGLEVCRLLRGRRATALLPIIHVSAVSTDMAFACEAIASGADGFFPSPVDPEKLASMLDALIVARGLQPSPGDRSGSGANSVLSYMTSREKRVA